MAPTELRRHGADGRPTRLAWSWCHDHSIPDAAVGSRQPPDQECIHEIDLAAEPGASRMRSLALSRLRNEGFELDRPVRQLGHRHPERRSSAVRRQAKLDTRPGGCAAHVDGAVPRPRRMNSIPRPSIPGWAEVEDQRDPRNGTSRQLRRDSASLPPTFRGARRHGRSSGGGSRRASSQSADLALVTLDAHERRLRAAGCGRLSVQGYTTGEDCARLVEALDGLAH